MPTVRNLDRVLVNRFFIVLIVLSNTVGNFLLSVGMTAMPNLGTVSVFAYIQRFATNWHIVTGIILLMLWMVAQLTMLTWADLSYVLPVTASGYILTALLGDFALHEHISPGRWFGILLIAVGSMLASMTPTQTVPYPQHGELTE